VPSPGGQYGHRIDGTPTIGWAASFAASLAPSTPPSRGDDDGGEATGTQPRTERADFQATADPALNEAAWASEDEDFELFGYSLADTRRFAGTCLTRRLKVIGLA
jgi:hypothetical protein